MEKRRSTEQRNTVTMGVTGIADSTFEWRGNGAQVKSSASNDRSLSNASRALFKAPVPRRVPSLLLASGKFAQVLLHHPLKFSFTVLLPFLPFVTLHQIEHVGFLPIRVVQPLPVLFAHKR